MMSVLNRSTFVACLLATAAPAFASPQSFPSTVTVDSASVPAQLFQSLGQRLRLAHLNELPSRPATMELGLAYLDGADDVRHARTVMGAVASPTPFYRNFDRDLARLEEGMTLLGGDLLEDGSLDDSAGAALCAQALHRLANDVLAIDQGYERAAWSLGVAEGDMRGIVEALDGGLASAGDAAEAAKRFFAIPMQLQDVAEGLLHPSHFSPAGNSSGGQGGTAGGAQGDCPDSHPYRACTTSRYLVYFAPICTDWFVTNESEGFLFFDGYVSVMDYERICSWRVAEVARTTCSCYATKEDRFWGNEPTNTTGSNEVTDLYNDFSVEFEAELFSFAPPPSNDLPAENPGPELLVD